MGMGSQLPVAHILKGWIGPAARRRSSGRSVGQDIEINQADHNKQIGKLRNEQEKRAKRAGSRL